MYLNDSYDNSSYTTYGRESQTVAHELGHTVGLNHVSQSATSIDNLTSDSPFIIEAIQIGDQSKINYVGVNFITTQLKIKQVIKGNLASTDNVITLLQTEITQDPLIKKDGHVLLFLEKYSGPTIQDAYVCKGLYQGHYDIDNNGNLLSSIDMTNENPNLNTDLKNNKSFENLKNKLKLKK